ncbi:MAG: divergent polysaccharide deacetylase family protein, partial [Desulfobacterales bacterium]|nr:divergent polysaccharide deacetylase family protein [Desulfobacterales bacterium]
MAQTKSTGGTKKRADKKAKPPKKTSKTAPKKSTKTKKKPGTTRKAGTKKPGKKKDPGAFHEVKKTVLGIAILVSVCLTVAMLADIFLQAGRPVPQEPEPAPKTQTAPQPKAPEPLPPGQTQRPPAAKHPATAEPKIISKAKGLKEKDHAPGKRSIPRKPVSKEGSTIVYEVYDGVSPTPPKKVVPPKKVNSIPRIAIIIDDIGYNKDLAMGLLKVDKNITFAILPFSPSGKQLARSLSGKGAELMLHLPMEPTQYPKVNPGPGA